MKKSQRAEVADIPREGGGKADATSYRSTSAHHAALPVAADDAALVGQQWKAVALALGERIARSGPPDYYAMSPVEWSAWANAAIAAELDTLIWRAMHDAFTASRKGEPST